MDPRNVAALLAVLQDYTADAAGAERPAGQALADGCVWEEWSLDAPIVGREAIVREVLDPYRSAYPDGRHELDRVLCDGDAAVVLATFSGTFERPYGDLQPTGTRVSWAVRDVWTFADGLAVRVEIGTDGLAAAAQLEPPAG